MMNQSPQNQSVSIILISVSISVLILVLLITILISIYDVITEKESSKASKKAGKVISRLNFRNVHPSNANALMYCSMVSELLAIKPPQMAHHCMFAYQGKYLYVGIPFVNILLASLFPPVTFNPPGSLASFQFYVTAPSTKYIITVNVFNYFRKDMQLLAQLGQLKMNSFLNLI